MQVSSIRLSSFFYGSHVQNIISCSYPPLDIENKNWHLTWISEIRRRKLTFFFFVCRPFLNWTILPLKQFIVHSSFVFQADRNAHYKCLLAHVGLTRYPQLVNDQPHPQPGAGRTWAIFGSRLFQFGLRIRRYCMKFRSVRVPYMVANYSMYHTLSLHMDRWPMVVKLFPRPNIILRPNHYMSMGILVILPSQFYSPRIQKYWNPCSKL